MTSVMNSQVIHKALQGDDRPLQGFSSRESQKPLGRSRHIIPYLFVIEHYSYLCADVSKNTV